MRLLRLTSRWERLAVKCRIDIAIDKAKCGSLAMIELAEIMTRLTAQILRILDKSEVLIGHERNR